MKLSKITEDKYNELPDDDKFDGQQPSHSMTFYFESGQTLHVVAEAQNYNVEYQYRGFNFNNLEELINRFGMDLFMNILICIVKRDRTIGLKCILEILTRYDYEKYGNLDDIPWFNSVDFDKQFLNDNAAIAAMKHHGITFHNSEMIRYLCGLVSKMGPGVLRTCMYTFDRRINDLVRIYG